MASGNFEITIHHTNLDEVEAWAAEYNDRPEGWRDPNPDPSSLPIGIPYTPGHGSASWPVGWPLPVTICAAPGHGSASWPVGWPLPVTICAAR